MRLLGSALRRPAKDAHDQKSAPQRDGDLSHDGKPKPAGLCGAVEQGATSRPRNAGTHSSSPLVGDPAAKAQGDDYGGASCEQGSLYSQRRGRRSLTTLRISCGRSARGSEFYAPLAPTDIRGKGSLSGPRRPAACAC